jgi:hypothetical protein
MPEEPTKEEKRRVQNRVAQRAFRERKRQAKDGTLEPVIRRRKSKKVSNQRARAYSNEGTDSTFISSPLEILSSDPASVSSPKLSASSFEIHSSQKELKSQQVHVQGQPTIAGTANHETQKFPQVSVPNISNNGSPNSSVYEQPSGNSLMQQSSDLFDPGCIKGALVPPQSGSPYGFQVADYPPSTPPVQRQSSDPVFRMLSQVIASRHEVRLAGIRLQEEKINLSVAESKFSVDVEHFHLECAELE